MRVLMSIAASLVVMLCAPLSLSADQKAFTGRWNLTGTGAHTDRIYWLEVKDEGGKLSGMFLNRGGSPVAVESIKVEGDELIFTIAARPNVPAVEHRAKLERGKLVGSTTDRGTAIQWVGVRPPTWPPADANAKHAYGKPIELFDGKSLDAFDAAAQGSAVRVDGGRWRDDERAEGEQPDLEAEVQGLQDPGGIQAGEGQQQRHLSARPLRAAGRRRLRQAGREPRSHVHLRVGRAEASTPASRRASGRRWKRSSWGTR